MEISKKYGKDFALILMSVAISILSDVVMKGLYPLICLDENVLRVGIVVILFLFAYMSYKIYRSTMPPNK